MTRTKPASLLAAACLVALCLAPVFTPASQRPSLRVVAVGDIHGDLDAFIEILRRAALIDSSRRWSGGRATLVQTGDFLDRGPKATPTMDFLMSLQKDAQSQGGRAIVLMGNHEAMNLFGDLRYATESDYAGFADQERRAAGADSAARPPGFYARCKALDERGKYGKWLRSLPAVARVGDSIFLHGGLRPELAAYTIDRLNDAMAGEIKAFDKLKTWMADKNIAQRCDLFQDRLAAARTALQKAEGKDVEMLNAFLNLGNWLTINENGPLWFRGYAEWSDGEGAPHIRRLLDAFHAARFVVGHTPQAGGQIASRFDGGAYLIDTGMLSSYFHGRASALDISDGKVRFIY